MEEHNTMTGMAAKSPGCLVVLLDYSQGLAESWVGESFSKAEGVVAELNRWCAGLAQLGDFGVAILGYQDHGDGADIRSLISPHPGLTSAASLSTALPVAAPTPAGSAPQCVALHHCATLLEEWRSKAPALPAAPVLLHIMTGPPSDGSPRDALRRIDQLPPCAGRPTVVNIHLCDGLGDPEFMPSEDPSDQMGRYLFRLSSPLGSEMRASAAQRGKSLPDGCRALAVQASAAELRMILEWVADYVSPWATMETRILWSFPPDAQLLPVPDGPSHLLACPDGRSFVAFGNRLFALTGDGQPVWSAEFPDVVLGGIAQGSDGALRVHTRDGLVTCIGADGRPRWKQPVGSPAGRATPIIDPFGNTLVLTHRGGLAAISPTGQLRSGYRSPAIRCQVPGVLHGETLYLGGMEQQLHALRLAEDGAEPLWGPRSSSKGRCGGPIAWLGSRISMATARCLSIRRRSIAIRWPILRAIGFVRSNWSKPVSPRSVKFAARSISIRERFPAGGPASGNRELPAWWPERSDENRSRIRRSPPESSSAIARA
jgi:hypothetical protein